LGLVNAQVANGKGVSEHRSGWRASVPTGTRWRRAARGAGSGAPGGGGHRLLRKRRARRTEARRSSAVAGLSRSPPTSGGTFSLPGCPGSLMPGWRGCRGLGVSRAYRKSHTPPQHSFVFGGGMDRSGPC
jgi:hypothetical protein